MRRVAYSKDALRTLQRLPVDRRRLFVSKIETYAADPAALANNVTALKGRPGEFRLRVGDWRIIMTTDADSLIVIKIAPRGSAYQE